ncbi:MAG TPA: SDR family NAD(P)-dependent oxidoreductase [Anaeromyxobacteraceae bacterium]
MSRRAHGLAVVTGASSGIGAALARALARRGQPVLAVARRVERLEALAAESSTLAAAIHPLALDLATGGAAEKVLAAADRLGGASWLVNNAGFGAYGTFAAQDPARLATMVRLNCEALVLLNRAFIPDLLAVDRGVILNVASAAAFQPTPFMALYGATKALVLAFSEALGEELAHTRITVTAFCPGPVETEFGQVSGYRARLKKPPGRISAEAAARAALAAADRGRAVAVPGPLNRFTSLAAQLLPRSLVRRASREVLRPGRDAEGREGAPWSGGTR